MDTVGETLSRDLTKQIAEIIQVDETDERAVHSEISEYVVTNAFGSNTTCCSGQLPNRRPITLPPGYLATLA